MASLLCSWTPADISKLIVKSPAFELATHTLFGCMFVKIYPLLIYNQPHNEFAQYILIDRTCMVMNIGSATIIQVNGRCHQRYWICSQIAKGDTLCINKIPRHLFPKQQRITLIKRNDNTMSQTTYRLDFFYPRLLLGSDCSAFCHR